MKVGLGNLGFGGYPALPAVVAYNRLSLILPFPL